MDKNKFIEELKKIDIEISNEQLIKLDQYYKILVEWNKFMNLTGITDENEVYLKHFYDSLSLTKSIDLNNIESLCDIGTGAGFPGLVIKIIYPNIKVTLVDSLNKRINFLNEVIKQLDLNKIETVHARAEEYGIKNREKFDLVVARAVAPLNILLEYCIPLVKEQKYFLAMKSNIDLELEQSKNALVKLDSEIIKLNQFNLPIENSLRSLILIKKNKKTNNKYPRKYKDIKIKPL